MNERQILMNRYSAFQLAAFELCLYLDTHPYDTAAMNRFRNYNTKANECRAEFESKYGPISSDSAMNAEKWPWISEPWPWNNMEEEF